MGLQGCEQDVAEFIADVRAVSGPGAERAPDFLDPAVAPDEHPARQVTAEVRAQLRALP
jgi:hypothetical protein